MMITSALLTTFSTRFGIRPKRSRVGRCHSDLLFLQTSHQSVSPATDRGPLVTSSGRQAISDGCYGGTEDRTRKSLCHGVCSRQNTKAQAFAETNA